MAAFAKLSGSLLENNQRVPAADGAAGSTEVARLYDELRDCIAVGGERAAEIAAHPDDDFKDPETWKKANPSLETNEAGASPAARGRVWRSGLTTCGSGACGRRG